jgi:hypothetical protein
VIGIVANQEHLDILRQGVEVWNKWREKHPEIRPDLSNGDLGGVDLYGADLDDVNLIDTDLNNARLTFARLNEANLGSANLSHVDLCSAHLTNAHLGEANLRGAKLRAANLGAANLISARLSGADLSSALLIDINFRLADLSSADLSDAHLGSTDLSGVNLNGTNFNQAVFGGTIFAEVDLSCTKGLETISHIGPSTVNINSVTLPHDEPTRLRFLRGVGFTETQIEYLPSLLTPRPIAYHSLFISYASQNDAIARQLHRDLRANDVPCWFAPHDLVPGDDFRAEIDKAIHAQDKLLIILSKDSVASKWVKYEVNRALNREIEQDRKILYPIRLDDSVLSSTSGWAADLRAHRHIGDFTRWKEHDEYQKGLKRLLRDLKQEAVHDTIESDARQDEMQDTRRERQSS